MENYFCRLFFETYLTNLQNLLVYLIYFFLIIFQGNHLKVFQNNIYKLITL